MIESSGLPMVTIKMSVPLWEFIKDQMCASFFNLENAEKECAEQHDIPNVYCEVSEAGINLRNAIEAFENEAKFQKEGIEYKEKFSI